MSTKQIIAELERQKAAGKNGRSWRGALLEVAVTCEGLPPDSAINHDHCMVSPKP